MPNDRVVKAAMGCEKDKNTIFMAHKSSVRQESRVFYSHPNRIVAASKKFMQEPMTPSMSAAFFVARLMQTHSIADVPEASPTCSKCGLPSRSFNI